MRTPADPPADSSRSGRLRHRLRHLLRHLLYLVIVVASATLTAACGVKGAPRPVEDTAALAPSYLKAQRTGTGVELQWSRPKESVDGTELFDLIGFDIERRRTGTGRFEAIHRFATGDTDRLRPRQSFRYDDVSAADLAWEYRVRAVLSDGQRGLPSPIASVARVPAAAKDEAR